MRDKNEQRLSEKAQSDAASCHGDVGRRNLEPVRGRRQFEHSGNNGTSPPKLTLGLRSASTRQASGHRRKVTNR